MHPPSRRAVALAILTFALCMTRLSEVLVGWASGQRMLIDAAAGALLGALLVALGRRSRRT